MTAACVLCACGTHEPSTHDPIRRLTAERDEARAEATRLREALTTDGAWLARLARGSSWPGEMAHRVEDAADRIVALATPPTDQGEGA